MRRGRTLILLALILLGIALAALFFLRAPTPPEPLPGGEVTPAPREATIIIAAQNIPRGAIIPADGVISAPFPLDMVVETMATDVGQVVGRRARIEIARGMPITTEMVTDQAGDLLATGSNASIAIEPGKTALSIPMDRLSGVAFALRDGDVVDVIVSMLIGDLDLEFQTILPNISSLLVNPDDGVLTSFVADFFDIALGTLVLEEPRRIGRAETDLSTGELLYVRPSETQRPRLITQRLVEKAMVLHVGTFPRDEVPLVTDLISPDAGGAPPPQEVTVEISLPPDIVTLVVTPQEALALNFAVKAGIDITLTLRGPGDFTETLTTMVSLEFLLNTYNMSIPTKLPYGIQPRLDALLRSTVLPSEFFEPAP
ncbi:MAG: hypothetical protein IIC78_02785 [Chloroflexi bacterium]|nr:hypothetical protein [Chloroflexota bacterium]